MMLPSRLGCPLSLKTPNMGNPGLHHFLGFYFPHSDACFVKAYPGRDDRGVLRRSRLGVLVPGRRAAEHLVRQHEFAPPRVLRLLRP